jgi:ABC-type Fe3+/spermidine/putrescine transport system ATPase subunit
MSVLELHQLRKTFTTPSGLRTTALESFSLDVEGGEFIALLGASGCGKTTTLRSIAGLETPDSGRVVIDGRVVFAAEPGARRVFVPPEKRELGMVFQSYALWPHMTVAENVSFGLKKKGLSKSDIDSKIDRALAATRMSEYKDRRISQLSGGQQQRVAVARAIAPEPRIILFDEPLSNIDARLRESLRLQVLDIQQRMGLTAVWVTHDQDEALGLASRIVLMNRGVVEQVGSPHEVWDHPATAFAADFIGSSSELRGQLIDPFTVDLGNGISLGIPGLPGQPSGAVRIFVRSESVRIGGEPGSENVIQAPLLMSKFHGDYTVVIVRVGSQQLTFRSPVRVSSDQASLALTIDRGGLMVYPDDGEHEPVTSSLAIPAFAR